MNHSDISCRVATRLDVESLLNLFPQITSRPHSLSAKTLGIENLRLKDAPETKIKKLEKSLRDLEEEIKDFTSKTKWVD